MEVKDTVQTEIEGGTVENTDSLEVADETEEIDYITKDPARKWQFDYNATTSFCNHFPELDVKEDSSQEVEKENEQVLQVSLAPGDGKIPSDILDEKDWDLKSFPSLHPNGQNGLHEPRKIRLTDQ